MLLAQPYTCADARSGQRSRQKAVRQAARMVRKRRGEVTEVDFVFMIALL